MHTLFYGEKNGIQVVATTSEENLLVTNTEKTSTILWDYEYEHLGIPSLLDAINLLSGEAIPLVNDAHKSGDFVTFFKFMKDILEALSFRKA